MLMSLPSILEVLPTWFSESHALLGLCPSFFLLCLATPFPPLLTWGVPGHQFTGRAFWNAEFDPQSSVSSLTFATHRKEACLPYENRHPPQLLCLSAPSQSCSFFRLNTQNTLLPIQFCLFFGLNDSGCITYVLLSLFLCFVSWDTTQSRAVSSQA